MLKSAMEIKYHGGQTFLIKGKKESVLVSPESNFPIKNRPRIVLFNEVRSEEMRPEGATVVVMGPGEYEIGGVEINGYSSGGGNTMYTVSVDGLTVGILGRLKEQLTDKRMDKINGVDVLVVDIKENGFIGPKAILKLAKTWGANYVVPVGYGENGDLKKFLDEADYEGLEPIDALKVDKDNLPDGTEVVILKETKF
jgi:hypothetical protein